MNNEQFRKAIDVMKQRERCEFCEYSDDFEECSKHKECIAVPYEDLRGSYILAIQALQEKLEREGNKDKVM